jgi:hypothetical protein
MIISFNKEAINEKENLEKDTLKIDTINEIEEFLSKESKS